MKTITLKTASKQFRKSLISEINRYSQLHKNLNIEIDLSSTGRHINYNKDHVGFKNGLIEAGYSKKEARQEIRNIRSDNNTLFQIHSVYENVTVLIDDYGGDYIVSLSKIETWALIRILEEVKKSFRKNQLAA